jgi:hypothetical protein
MDVLERIARGYHAVGPGAPRAVLAMFHQEEDDAPEWEVYDFGDSGRAFASRGAAALDLFGALPSHWELTGVDLRMWDPHPRRSRLVAGGLLRARPRGSWATTTFPFLHIWTFSGEQVVSVIDYLAGIEVRRRGVARIGRRGRWWRRRDEAKAAG